MSFLSLERQLRLDQKEKCKQAASQNYAKEHIFTPAGMTVGRMGQVVKELDEKQSKLRQMNV